MDNQENERVITLEDLWGIFVEHLIPIAAAAVIALLGVFLYSRLFVKPKYNSTATLYVLRQGGEDYAYTQSDFTLALNVVNDCTYMLKSHAVLDEVIDELELSLPFKTLKEAISTSNPSGTRVLEVSIKADTPEEAKRIVDAVCIKAADKISQAMGGVDQVNVYSKGTLEQSPCNGVGLTKYALAAVAAAVLVYAIFLVAFMLDDKIHTEEDIEKYLGLTVLASIPNSEDGEKGKKYHGYYAYKYKSGKDGAK